MAVSTPTLAGLNWVQVSGNGSTTGTTSTPSPSPTPARTTPATDPAPTTTAKVVTAADRTMLDPIYIQPRMNWADSPYRVNAP